jgi:murein DD-endopeptidase MepM/ murein hydrolase activator NlpD
MVVGSAGWAFVIDSGAEIVTTARAVSAPSTPRPPADALLAPVEEPPERSADRSSLSSRDGAVSTTPLPTPVPVDPAATPLAAPAGPGTPAGAPGAATALAFPVPGGTISQSFRPGHEGVDIAAAPGVPVVAAESGIVTWAGWRNNGGGLVVEIQHEGAVNTVYNHLGSIAVVPGQSVSRATVIGGMGCSGTCYGPHIQFDVRIGGRLVNPLALL